MPPENENGELKKAQFYYDAVVKADEISTRSYERTNTKISLFIGVLSAVIPILTGVGYVVLSNMIAVPFFLFFVVSLILFVIALAECVHLLGPKYFDCVDFGEFMIEYDKKPLDFIIFKIAHSWEDVVKGNVKRMNTLFSGLQRVVRLIIVGLVALTFSFTLLGIDYYAIDILSNNEPYKDLLSANDWRLTFFIVCAVIFMLLVSYIVKHTKDKNDSSALNLPNSSENTKENLPRDSKTNEERRIRRESGMLVVGVVLGGLFGIVGGLWSAYFVEWFKSTYGPNFDWTLTMILSSLFLGILLAFLILWARKQMKE
jgi:preprotein translocase subunit SecG